MEQDENNPYKTTNLLENAGFQPDTIVQSVIDSFMKRAKIGKEKYGQTLDREDLSVLDWIQHAKEEHMDAILYLTKLEKMLGGNK